MATAAYRVFRGSNRARISSIIRYGSQSLSSQAQISKLRIVFGSQTGTAEAFANDLEFDAQDLNLETELIDAANFSVQRLAGPENSLTAFVLACYGEGEPTDNAKKFYEELMSKDSKVPSLNSASFAVFGLGNSQCFRDRFNVIGKRVDQRLQDLGAHQVLPCGLGDASKNINAEFTAWKNSFLKVAQDFHPPSEKIDVPSTPASDSIIAPERSQSFNDSGIALSVRQLALAPANRPIILAEVTNSQQLFSVIDEFSSAMHITFDLKRSHPLIPIGCSGLTPDALTRSLQAGDHIGIFAPNSRHVVEKFAVAAGLSLQELQLPFAGSDNAVTLRQVLTWQISLTGTIPLTTLKVLHKWAQDPATGIPLTAKYLQSLINDYDTGFRSKGYDITSVLEMIPKRRAYQKGVSFPLAALLKTLPPLAPRLYSFTHNPVNHRETASLLCRLLRYRPSLPYVTNPSSRIVDGVCSSYLNEGIAPGDEVAIFFRESTFHLPLEIQTPVIMIAGGTGIAPFISFLEERLRLYDAAKSNGKPISFGPAVLYYGSRNAEEYMFREELLRFIKDSNGVVLSKLVVAFSSPTEKQLPSQVPGTEIILPHSKNIPTVALEDTEYLTPLIDQGGHIYVCGGAGNFGKAVRFTVNELVKKTKSGASIASSPEADQEGVRLLVQEKRYFEDLAD